jgi:hypothetical protein
MNRATAAEYALLLTEDPGPAAARDAARGWHAQRPGTGAGHPGRPWPHQRADRRPAVYKRPHVSSHLDRMRDKTGRRRRADLTRLARPRAWSDSPAVACPALRDPAVGRLPPAARKRGQLILAPGMPRRESLPGEGPDSRPRPPARETMMDPHRDPQIVRNRIAELHDQAERADLALAIGRPAAHAAYSSRTARRPAAESASSAG